LRLIKTPFISEKSPLAISGYIIGVLKVQRFKVKQFASKYKNILHLCTFYTSEDLNQRRIKSAQRIYILLGS